VAATAQFVDQVISAADPHLPADSITLVVSNYSTVASVRAWTKAGDDVLRRCEHFLRNPSRDVARDPNGRRLAAAVAKAAPLMVQYGARIMKPTAKKPVATIDEKFVGALDRLSSPPTATTGFEHPITGTTQIYSPIYRIGRTDEGKEVRARIRVDDRPYDVMIDDSAVATAFDMAKAGATVPIDIMGGWSRDSHNGLLLDAARARIIRIGAGWKPISGADFLDAVHATLPDVFSELTDALPGDVR
jgi:hypothetical protein